MDVRRRRSTYVNASTYVDIRRRTSNVRRRTTSTYVDIRRRTSTCVDVRRRTPTDVDVGNLLRRKSTSKRHYVNRRTKVCRCPERAQQRSSAPLLRRNTNNKCTRAKIVCAQILNACEIRTRTNFIRVQISYAYEFGTRTNFIRVRLSHSSSCRSLPLDI